MKHETTNRSETMRLESTDKDGTRTYHYTGQNSDGITCGMVRKINRDGRVVENRKMVGADVERGWSIASRRFGH